MIFTAELGILIAGISAVVLAVAEEEDRNTLDAARTAHLIVH